MAAVLAAGCAGSATPAPSAVHRRRRRPTAAEPAAANRRQPPRSRPRPPPPSRPPRRPRPAGADPDAAPHPASDAGPHPGADPRPDPDPAGRAHPHPPRPPERPPRRRSRDRDRRPDRLLRPPARPRRRLAGQLRRVRHLPRGEGSRRSTGGPSSSCSPTATRPSGPPRPRTSSRSATPPTTATRGRRESSRSRSRPSSGSPSAPPTRRSPRPTAPTSPSRRSRRSWRPCSTSARSGPAASTASSTRAPTTPRSSNSAPASPAANSHHHGARPHMTETAGVEQRTRVAAYAIAIDDQDRILLARMAPGQPGAGRWTLPGGGLDHGEDPAAGVLRELEEEAGLSGRVLRIIGVTSRVLRIERPAGEVDLHALRDLLPGRGDGRRAPRRGGRDDRHVRVDPARLRPEAPAHAPGDVGARLPRGGRFALRRRPAVAAAAAGPTLWGRARAASGSDRGTIGRKSPRVTTGHPGS